MKILMIIVGIQGLSKSKYYENELLKLFAFSDSINIEIATMADIAILIKIDPIISSIFRPTPIVMV